MALSMMVEKESGEVEGNEFDNLWSRVAQREGGVRYESFVACFSDFILGEDSSLLEYRFRNAVTGSIQADAPMLCRGGLLADVCYFFYNTQFCN